MKIELLIFFAYTVCLYTILWFRAKYDYSSENKAPFQPKTSKIFENCEFPKHEMKYRSINSTSIVSKNICTDRKDLMTRLNELIIHMRLVAHKEELDGVIAFNFGVPIRVAYLRELDMVFINPVVLSGVGVKYCVEQETSDGPLLKKNGRFKEITLNTLDEGTLSVMKQVSLKGAASCIIQSLLDQMNGNEVDVVVQGVKINVDL